MQLPKAVVLKMIGQKHFTIELVESESGSYYIVEDVRGSKHFSGPINDYKLADAIFYEKLQELEGF